MLNKHFPSVILAAFTVTSTIMVTGSSSYGQSHGQNCQHYPAGQCPSIDPRGNILHPPPGPGRNEMPGQNQEQRPIDIPRPNDFQRPIDIPRPNDLRPIDIPRPVVP